MAREPAEIEGTSVFGPSTRNARIFTESLPVSRRNVILRHRIVPRVTGPTDPVNWYFRILFWIQKESACGSHPWEISKLASDDIAVNTRNTHGCAIYNLVDLD